MALVEWSECKKQIASNAKSCPSCGNIMETNKEIISDRTYNAVPFVIVWIVVIPCFLRSLNRMVY